MRPSCVLGLALLASCATVIDGGKNAVPVSSEPPGATIVHDGAAVGVTPATLMVERGKATRTYELRLAGFAPHRIDLEARTNWWFAANIPFLALGLIGMGVDLATGSAWKYDETPIHVVLQAQK